MRTKFATTGRIVIAAVCGTIQLILLLVGSFHLFKMLKEDYPAMKSLIVIVPVLALFSLLWPIYIFGVAKTFFLKSQQSKENLGG